MDEKDIIPAIAGLFQKLANAGYHVMGSGTGDGEILLYHDQKRIAIYQTDESGNNWTVVTETFEER